ncbi:MAG: aminoglycoside phosphotransferase family protein [Bacteroidales bacterium]|nr:aminoglycoside phosphotransferase family protein [Bacteroidales bacterium]
MDFDVSKLSEIFRIPEGHYTIEHLQHGHINKTFRVIENGTPRFILQKINTGVFNNPDSLMANYQLVTSSLNASFRSGDFRIKTPEIIQTQDGSLYYTDNQINYWRLITYIEGIEFDKVRRDDHTAYEGGLAFGSFLSGVSGIDPALLYVILPDFHSLQKRYSDFLNAMESNPANRASLISQEIEFVKSRNRSMQIIPDLIAKGEIPLRVVHNDTKLSNVIFSHEGKAVGVIDLDTVMPGSALFDFGDAIRSCANSACEDEPDLTKVMFEIGFFKAFSKGFAHSAKGILNKTEINHLPESALLLTYIIGIRFLTDYLNGDVYYHTQYAEHNLVRARVQFSLLSQMESQLNEMHLIINQLVDNLSEV